MPTLLHRSCSNGSSPDISFAPSTLALFCSWEVLQDLGSDQLPILLTGPLPPVFRPNNRSPFFSFLKAHWDDFAFYFDSYCPFSEEYSSLSFSSAAALFTSLALNAFLTIWCSGQTALFRSLLAKAAPAYFPTALSVTLTPLFSFQQAQSCSSFSAEACAILHALYWSRQHQQFCLFYSLFLLLDSRSVVATLFSPTSFLLPQTSWQIWKKLSSLSPFILSG